MISGETTPTGHRYHSRHLEQRLAQLTAAA